MALSRGKGGQCIETCGAGLGWDATVDASHTSILCYSFIKRFKLSTLLRNVPKVSTLYCEP
jgi:hypothetical protein